MNDKPIPVNILDVDTKKHPTERSIRVTKERFRCTSRSLPFTCMPNAIFFGAVHEATGKINRLPRSKGVPSALSPLTIVYNAAKIDFNILSLQFGKHVEAHEDNELSINSPDTRGTPAIALYPTFNST